MKKVIRAGIIILTGLAAGYLLVVPYIYEKKIQKGIADKVLRFHIMANSDSEEDQQLKLLVRDAVGGYLGEQLDTAKNKAESEKIIEDHMEEILEVASATIRQQGYDYTVVGEISTTGFPAKTYGRFTFPEGNYDALRITIGEGKGHNWWCVLYPEMCFSDSVYEINPETEEILRKVLTTEEYKKVLGEGKYRIGWKFLEYFR